MEMESLFQRLFHREHLLLPMLLGPPNVWPGSRLPLSHSIQKALHSFLALCSPKTSMFANWLELKLSCFLCCWFFFAQPKPHANASFLLFVTLPTLAQETQNLKIQGLTPSK